MEEDFDLIACDYFVHEYQNMRKYHQREYLEEEEYSETERKLFQNIVLNRMFGGYKEGSAFAKAQFLYLYKKYYKKEYDQIKRFTYIDTRNLLELIRAEPKIFEFLKQMARILVMARIIGIQIDDDCFCMYLFLDEWNKDLHRDACTRRCISEHTSTCISESTSERTHMKNAEENRLDVIEWMFCDKVKNGHEFRIDRNPEEILYNPEEILLATNRSKVTDEGFYPVPPQIASEKETWRVQDVGHPMSEMKKLVKEREALIEKVRMLEKNEKSCRNVLAQKERTLRKQENHLKKYKDEHTELIALRNYVYGLTQLDVENMDIPINEMKKKIVSRHIIVVGGHENWVKKMKREFLSWTFIPARVTGSVNVDIIKNAEKVYFFTDTMSHCVYYRYIQVAREYGVPFGYIHDVNIHKNITQIFMEMSELEQ